MRLPTVRSPIAPTRRPPMARRPGRLHLRRLRRSPVSFWLTALALAGLVALTVASTTPTDEEAGAPGRTQLVPVASGAFERGHRLEATDVDWRELPAVAVPADRATETDGRVVVEPIADGEIVVETRLGPVGADGTAALLPPDTRAIAIPLSLGAPPLQTGDRVDLLATFDVTPAEAARGQRLVARDATVVAVEEEAVTVAVDEDDAPDAAVALATGAVVIALVGLE